MKPIHLNLASRPYRDYRPVYAAVVVMSLLAAFLMLQNIDTYYRYIHETRATRAKIAQLEEQTRREAELQRGAQQRLAALDLRLLDDQTRFINAKLAERAFSWSVLLDELETILPKNVRILSIAPKFSPDGAIDLMMTFEAKTATGLIDTLNNLNSDPQFVNAFPGSETHSEKGHYSFNITTGYRPAGAVVKTSGVIR